LSSEETNVDVNDAAAGGDGIDFDVVMVVVILVMMCW
jgi:hypothetical protein